jgi:hypothetical protein
MCAAVGGGRAGARRAEASRAATAGFGSIVECDLLGRYQEQPIVGVSLARTDPAGSPVSPAEI